MSNSHTSSQASNPSVLLDNSPKMKRQLPMTEDVQHVLERSSKKNKRPTNLYTSNPHIETSQLSTSPSPLEMEVNVFDKELEDELNKLALPLIEKRLQTLEEEHSKIAPAITKDKEPVTYDIFDEEMNRQLDLLALRGILSRLEKLKAELTKSPEKPTKNKKDLPTLSNSDEEVQSTATSPMFPDD